MSFVEYQKSLIYFSVEIGFVQNLAKNDLSKKYRQPAMVFT